MNNSVSKLKFWTNLHFENLRQKSWYLFAQISSHVKCHTLRSLSCICGLEFYRLSNKCGIWQAMTPDFYVRKCLYQFKNMTVIIHSFDVWRFWFCHLILNVHLNFPRNSGFFFKLFLLFTFSSHVRNLSFQYISFIDRELV